MRITANPCYDFIAICLFISLFAISHTSLANHNDNPIFHEETVEDPAGNVAISMTPIGVYPKYGVSIPFNINVTNQGANNVFDVVVSNTIPAGYTFDPTNTGWTVDASDPNTYTNTIAGPIGASASSLITLHLIPIAAADSTDWINEAEITEFRDAPGGTICIDSDVSDNSVAAAVSIFDLALRKELITAGPYTYGQTLLFRTYIENQGNMPATEIEVIDYIPEGYDYDPVANAAYGWSGGVAMGTPSVLLPGQLNAGEQTFVDIELTFTMEMFDGMAWNNYTEIKGAKDVSGTARGKFDADSEADTNSEEENMVLPGGPDDDNMNGGGPLANEDEDDHDPAAPVIFDLAFTKIQQTALPSFSYGELASFRNRVYNQGNQTVDNVEIVDYVPCGLEFNAADNPGWTFNSVTRIAHYTFANPIAPSYNDYVDLHLLVVQCYEDQETAWTNYGEIAGATDLSGLPFTDIDSVMDSIDNNDEGAIFASSSDNQLDGGGPKAGEDEDDHDVNMIEVVDLALKKRIFEEGPFNFGDTITFVNTVFNQGNVILDSIRIRDYLPSGYSFPADINPTWAIGVFGYPEGLIPDMLLPSDTINYELHLILQPADDRTDYYNYSELILAQDTTTNFNRNRFDDADSFVGTNSAAEKAVTPGSPDDDNIFGDGFEGEDSDDHDVAGALYYDLALTKDLANPISDVKYGMSVEFTITVENQGTIEANAISVVDYLPCGYSFDQNDNPDWTLDPMTGYVTNDVTSTITPGASIQLPLILTIVACDNVDSESYANKAEISVDDDDDIDSTPNDDPDDDEEDEDDIDDTRIAVHDLSLVKTISSAAASYSIGDPISFDITVINEGTDTVQNIKVVDYLPCGFSFVPNNGWTMNATSGLIEYTYTSKLASGENFVAPLELTLVTCDQGGEDNYLNGAEVSEFEDTDDMPLTDADSTPDEIQGNDGADEDDYDEIGIDIYDLSLTKSMTNAPNTLAYGSTISYDITVTNEGTLEASAVEVVDYIPCGMRYEAADNSIAWTIDPTNGNAYYNLPTALAPGETSTVEIVLTLEPCDTPTSDSFNNKAEISSDDGDDDDSDPDDNPDNDDEDEDDNDDEPIAIYDLSLTKEITSGDMHSVGDMISYDITVANEGSETVQNIKVVDYLPCGFSFVANNGWTMNATSGLIEYTYTAELAAGENFVAPLELTLVSCDQGGEDNYLNGAEISDMEDTDGMSVDDIDSTPDEIQGNDGADEDDYDEIGIDIYDLSLTKSMTNAPNTLAYGSTISYDITVTNEGTLEASAVEVVDYIPCGMRYEAADNSIAWTIDPTNGNAYYNLPTALAPGETSTVEIVLTLEPCDTPTSDSFNNKAEISSDDGDDDDSDPDDNPDNDNEDEDDNDDEPIAIYDLALSKTVQGDPTSFSVGEVAVFEIEVTNEGNTKAYNVDVIDYVPCGFSSLGIDNMGWNSQAGSNYLHYVIDSIDAGETTIIELQLRLVSCQPNTALDHLNEAEISEFTDDEDVPQDDIDSTPDDIPGDPDEEDDSDTQLIVVTGNLGGDVWKDLDFDGIHDTNEPPVEGMLVNLYDCNNNFIGSTTTGQTGFYVFVNLLAGDYKVEFVLSSLDEPCLFTLPNVGTNDALDSDANSDGFTQCITLEVSEENYTLDAGLIENLGSIGDFVFVDLDGDGIQDFNEYGIGGVSVYLHTEGGLVIDSTVTSSNGLYLFEGVSEGYYYVSFGVGEEYIPTTPDATTDTRDSDVTEENGDNSTDIFYLSPGQNKSDIDGGFYECATICGYTWLDLVKQNDLRDSDENGINGMKVTLYRQVNGSFVSYDKMYTGHDPDTPSDDGYFNFCVPPGNYYLEFSLPPLGLVQVLPLSGPQYINSDVNNAHGRGTTSTFYLGNGVEKCDIGAGYTLMYQLGNAVWFDENFNGLREETEEPVEGVVVQAYDLNNIMIAQAVTDENGYYNIDYLEKKDYYLKFTAAGNMSFTQALVGDDERVDSDVDHSYGPNTTRAFLGVPGETNYTVDAGIVFGVLPVEWTYVRAENRGESNVISWGTATEINNDKFIIQRSKHANQNFETIGEVRPEQTNSSSPQSYTFHDKDLLWNQYYYRIIQRDIDGREMISKVVFVQIATDHFLVYPNPTAGILKVQSAVLVGLESVRINVYNQLGELVMDVHKNPQGNSDIELSTEHLVSGIYNIEILDRGNTLYTQRFIKK